MKSGPGAPRARDYTESLARRGRHHFTSAEARAALGVSAQAATAALNRLAKQSAIASPVRGFFVIVPPEYRSLGCLPAEQFVPALMKYRGQLYYAGLLTAAQYHGAAHQRPQEFQVLVERPRRAIACGRVRVAFIVRKRLRNVPVETVNTPRGVLVISTPEATALDLVGYCNQAGGLNQAATVLAELAERIDPDKLAVAGATVPMPWVQRLGYLLEHVGAGEKAALLKAHVRARAHESALLVPRARRANAKRNDDWKLYVNAEVEIQL